MKQGIVYRIRCMPRPEDDRKTKYMGESARTSYDGGSEGLEALKGGQEGHPLVENQQEEHPD